MRHPKNGRFPGLLASLSLLVPLLLGCGEREFAFQSGTYYGNPWQLEETDPNRAKVAGTILVVNKEEGTARLQVPGAPELVLTLAPRPASDWFRGCPTNASVGRMETMTVSPGPILVGSIRINNPLLVAECGWMSDLMSEPTLLPSSTPRGTGGSACSFDMACLTFRK